MIRPFAHIDGIPVEETLGSLGPALLVAFGVAWAHFALACDRSTLAPAPPARRRRS